MYISINPFNYILVFVHRYRYMYYRLHIHLPYKYNSQGNHILKITE